VGLYDYRARWYEPTLGRFVQPDTLVPEPGKPQALNRYTYVYNNPLNYTDPSGNDPWWCDTPECYRRYLDGLTQNPSSPPPWQDLDALETWLLRTMIENAEGEIAGEIRHNLYGGSSLWAYQLWIEQVQTGGPWDFKEQIIRDWGRGVWLAGSGWWSYEVAANIHYGFVGIAAGFTDIELLGGAGAAQVYDHFIKPRMEGKEPDRDALGTLRTYFDEPEDQAAIKIGIELAYWYYGRRDRAFITFEEFQAKFREIFRRYASDLKPGPAPPWFQEMIQEEVRR